MVYGKGRFSYWTGVVFGALIKDSFIGEWIRGGRDAVYADIELANANKALVESYRLRHESQCEWSQVQTELIEALRLQISAMKRSTIAKHTRDVLGETFSEYMEHSSELDTPYRKLSSSDLADYICSN